MSAKILRQSGDNFLVRDDTGKVRKVKRDRKGIKRGDFLQPNQDKDEFIKRYGYHPTEDKRDVDKFLSRRGLLNKKYGDFR